MIWYILCHTTGSGSQPAAGIGRPAPPLTTREGAAPDKSLASRALGGSQASRHCPLVALPFRGQCAPRRKAANFSGPRRKATTVRIVRFPARHQLQSPAPAGFFPLSSQGLHRNLPGCCRCRQPAAGHVVAPGHLTKVCLPSPPLSLAWNKVPAATRVAAA